MSLPIPKELINKITRAPLTKDEKTKAMQFLLSILQMEKEQENILTGEKIKVIQATLLASAYLEKQAEWQRAAIEANNLLAATPATTPREVHDQAINAHIVNKPRKQDIAASQAKVRMALTDWVENGFKNEYEAVVALLDALSEEPDPLVGQ